MSLFFSSSIGFKTDSNAFSQRTERAGGGNVNISLIQIEVYPIMLGYTSYINIVFDILTIYEKNILPL